jgi:hypothetical protein
MIGVGWPTELPQDTTLSQLVFDPDTLTAWSLSGGGPALDPSRGQMVVDLRDEAGGNPLTGHYLRTIPDGGGHAILQSETVSALLINVLTGSYTVVVMEPSGEELLRTSGIVVLPGRVVHTRLEL